MSEACNIKHPLQREGTYQWQRFPAGLREGFYKPDDRSIEQLVMQVAQYAQHVKYYDTNLQEWGRWELFFEYLYDYQSKKLKFANIDALLQNKNTPPHLGLLLSFLKTFQTTRDELNRFTTRHLDFYYQDVLQLSRKPASPDKVAVIFEPEKNNIQAKVEEGRELNAGKDPTKKDLVYKTLREIIVNQVSIASKKSVLVTKNTSGNLFSMHVANDAAVENSFVQNNIQSWRPFGTPVNPEPEIGFAVSSPMLFAKDGRRRLSIEIEGGAAIPRDTLRAVYTGPKGWIEAEVDIAPGPAGSNSATAKRFLLVKIDETLPAVAAYDEKVHKSKFVTTYPVIKLLVKKGNYFNVGYDFFTTLSLGAIKKMVMNVDGAKSFTLSGENGKLNPLQAFKPFGNTPIKNKSFFTIGSPEAFNKYLAAFHLAINWKGAPGNMAKYYSSYTNYLNAVALTDATSPISKDTISSFNSQWSSFNQGNVPGKVELMSGGQWRKVDEDKNANYTRQNRGASYNTFKSKNVISDEYESNSFVDFNESSRWGYARVTLNYNFGHQIFPLVMSHTVTTNALGTVATVKPVPPPPYTPEFNSLFLDYVLEANINITDKDEHRFFQLHPFGYAEIESTEEKFISDSYRDEGQLYIGFANCNTPQTINLYIARLDGTEDIDSLIQEKIKWSYLSGNNWNEFKYEQVTVDSTHAFTASGFISLAIPAEALLPNTLMGENLVWIKVSSANSAAAYPSILDIHTNAVEAIFDDRSNDPLHLQVPLPASTISKPVVKIDGVKSLTQPYASYDGKMSELAEAYYTRISERLRHKLRNWSIWDHEHLVLEHFPSIYKLKCISHARPGNMRAPGYVLCIALPATINLPEKDLLQPRVSKAVLTAAAEYTKNYMGPFAKIEFVNPSYEPITVKCSVKIKPGFDESFYANQLNKDLQTYLAPWILDKKVSPSFGGIIYASSIINFIEELPYIDYLTHFEAFKLVQGVAVEWKESTQGSNETVILTSALQHLIDTNAIC